MVHKIPGRFDSRYRFVLVAAERAKQLQNGAPANIRVQSRKPAYVAIKEAEADLIDFDILSPDMNIEEELVEEVEEEVE